MSNRQQEANPKRTTQAVLLAAFGVVAFVDVSLAQDGAGAGEIVVQEAAPAATPTTEVPSSSARPAAPEFTARYRLLGEVAEWLARASEAAPDLARPLLIGANDALRPPALEIARPGPIPPAERPTILLLGGLDGVSLAGGEAVLSVIADVLQHPESLPLDCTLIAVPWASPEALTLALVNDVNDGRNARPVDDDRDGATDEDEPDDLDGDQLALSMLIPDPKGHWTRAADPRFVVPALPSDGLRYTLAREGRDDDHDGRFNEDPRGGVVLDLNFPLGRASGRALPIQGALPLSEPLAREYADLVLARRTLAVVLFQGNHGALACPGGVASDASLVLESDRPIFERAGESFALATGRRGVPFLPLAKARGYERPGAALDWFHAVPRCLALEAAVWGPCVETASAVAAQDARFKSDSAPHTLGFGNGRAAATEFDRAWANWLDNTHGGLGFVTWNPVTLEGGVEVLVGGFEPRTVDNPPAAVLARAIHGSSDFVRQLVAAAPRLELSGAEATRDGDVCRLRVRVRNSGSLPTGLEARAGSRREQGVRVGLRMPEGAELLAGRASVERPRLLGGETTETFEWLVLAPAGSTFELRATAEWTLPATLEVRP